MDVYVVLGYWRNQGSSVLGAAADKTSAEEIADRASRHWGPWSVLAKEARWCRDALPQDGVPEDAKVWQEIVKVPLAGLSTAGQLPAALGEAVRREMAEQPVVYDAPTVEVSGSGPHYVWNDDRTGVVPKNGPIDASKPFFLASEPADSAGHPVGVWPSGWKKIGATVENAISRGMPGTLDPGEAPPPLRGERMAADMRRIFEAQKLVRADDIRVGDGPAWEWLKAGLDKLTTYPSDAPMPDSRAAAMIWGLPVIRDPNIPPDQIRLGDVVYVVGPSEFIPKDTMVRFDLGEMERVKREFAKRHEEWLREAIRSGEIWR